MLKRLRAGKYREHVQAKAAYEANRPTEPTYKVDETDRVFDTITDEAEEQRKKSTIFKKPLKLNKHKKKAMKRKHSAEDD
jgi:hypothetical protein